MPQLKGYVCDNLEDSRVAPDGKPGMGPLGATRFKLTGGLSVTLCAVWTWKPTSFR